MAIKSTDYKGAKREIYNLVTDVLSDKGQKEISLLLTDDIPNEKGRGLADEYIDKIKNIIALDCLLVNGNIDVNVSRDEIEMINSIQVELYKHKLNYMVIDIESNMPDIKRLTGAHLITTQEDINSISRYINKINEINDIHTYLTNNKYISILRDNLKKLETLEDLKSRLVSFINNYKAKMDKLK